MSADQGRAGVVGELVNGAVAEIARARSAADGEQLELLAPPTRFAPGSPELEQLQAATRRPGRPAGAENRATAAFREWLLKRGVHPLETLMRWSLHTPDTLARELGCSKLEAFRELRALLEGLAPFFASKVAPTDAEGRAVPLFQLNIGGAGAPGAAPGAAPWLYIEHEQNQPLAPADAIASHGTVSHGRAK